MKGSIVVLFGVMLLCCTDPIQARGPGVMLTSGSQLTANAVASDMPPNVPNWGIGSPIAYVVPGWTFNPQGNIQFEEGDDGYIFKLSGTAQNFNQTFHLPSGAVVDGVTPFYYDADAAANVGLGLVRYIGTSSSGLTWVGFFGDSTSGSSGYQGGYHALPAPETIRNVDPGTGETTMYRLIVYMDPSGSATDLRFGGAVVWYRLQITPAPATATFTDVPTGYWAFRHIEALAASGITAGCGGSNFCPENYVKRSEMAVYLAKALGLHWSDAYTLP